MDVLQRELNKKKVKYEKFLNKAHKAIENAPQGHIRVSNSHGKPTYYLKDSNEGINKERYISKKDYRQIISIVEAEYATKLAHELKKQIQYINDFEAKYKPENLPEIYGEMPNGKKILFDPYVYDDEKTVKKWQEAAYVSKPFENGAIEIFSEKGERVRSKSEKIIADKLFALGIPYKYEAPLHLLGIGTIYPDFTLLNLLERKEMYWEHFGMMDKPEYAEKAVRKIMSYEKNGIYPGQNLILTFETSTCPINIRIIEEMLLKELNF